MAGAGSCRELAEAQDPVRTEAAARPRWHNGVRLREPAVLSRGVPSSPGAGQGLRSRAWRGTAQELPAKAVEGIAHYTAVCDEALEPWRLSQPCA